MQFIASLVLSTLRTVPLEMKPSAGMLVAARIIVLHSYVSMLTAPEIFDEPISMATV
jgi:hypothetical protein